MSHQLLRFPQGESHIKMLLYQFKTQDIKSQPIAGSQFGTQRSQQQTHHHHHHQSLSSEGHWGTTDDFATSFLHFSLFSTALWDLVNSRPVHSLMLSSHLVLCLPYLLPPFTVPCKMVLACPDERET